LLNIFSTELHDPLRQLVIMTESEKNIDKTRVEIVANAAAKIAVSYDIQHQYFIYNIYF
jgi:hypothetical protein